MSKAKLHIKWMLTSRDVSFPCFKFELYSMRFNIHIVHNIKKIIPSRYYWNNFVATLELRLSYFPRTPSVAYEETKFKEQNISAPIVPLKL